MNDSDPYVCTDKESGLTSLQRRIHEALDCSPTNKEHELGLSFSCCQVSSSNFKEKWYTSWGSNFTFSFFCLLSQ